MTITEDRVTFKRDARGALIITAADLRSMEPAMRLYLILDSLLPYSPKIRPPTKISDGTVWGTMFYSINKALDAGHFLSQRDYHILKDYNQESGLSLGDLLTLYRTAVRTLGAKSFAAIAAEGNDRRGVAVLDNSSARQALVDFLNCKVEGGRASDEIWATVQSFVVVAENRLSTKGDLAYKMDEEIQILVAKWSKMPRPQRRF